MRLARVGGRFAVVRLDAAAPLPPWAAALATAALASPSLGSVTRTEDELSIVCAESAVPDAARAERGLVAVRVVGTIDFAVVGVLARLTTALAAADVSVFALSTFDTDYLLVRAGDLGRARSALAVIADVTAVTDD